MDLIKLGTIIKTIGVNGDILATDMPIGIRLPAGSTVFIGFSESFIEQYTLQADCVVSKNKVSLKLKNINSPEPANQLKEKAIFADKNSILQNNVNYIFEEDIINCEVIDNETGEIIGEIVEVWYLPANDVWLLRSAWGDIPLPVIDDVITKKDFSNKKIWINLLNGLIDIALK